jgi:protein TonB
MVRHSTIVEVDMRISLTGAVHPRLRFGMACGLALALGGVSPAAADTMAKIDHAYPAPPAEYPAAAQDRGEQGDVLIEIRVASNGRPSRMRLKQSSGFRDLDEAAQDAVVNWRYVPAVVDGDTSTSWMTVRIHYALPQPAPQPSPTPAAK